MSEGTKVKVLNHKCTHDPCEWIGLFGKIIERGQNEYGETIWWVELEDSRSHLGKFLEEDLEVVE